MARTMPTAHKLLVLRGERTREEVAAVIGITASAIYMYETGKRVPNDALKVRLARLYDTTVGWLFFDEGEPPAHLQKA